MTVALLIVGCALVLAAAYLWTARHGTVQSRLRSRVLVTLKTGEVFDGVLFEHDTKALVLRNAAAVAAGEGRTDVPLDGELIVLLPDVAFIQKP